MATPPDDMSVQQAIVWLAKNGVKIEVGDVEIGAVEVKDATSDRRATVDANGDLHVLATPHVNGLRTQKTEADVPLTTSYQGLNVGGGGYRNFILKNTEPPTGSKIYFSLLPAGSEKDFPLDPGESVTIEGLSPFPDVRVKGETGGETFSFVAWG